MPVPRGISTGTVAWFHPVSGIAGDMALGALLDAGASLEYVRSAVAGLDVSGWELASEAVKRAGIAATKAVVTTEQSRLHSHAHTHAHAHGESHAEPHSHGDTGQRRWSDIAKLLAEAEFRAERVRERSQQIFERLAIAESQVHGIDPAEVHFHEVGALDAIVDIVGVAAALESLGVDAVGCGPVAVGTGQVATDHGMLPNPAPAVVRLLDGFEVKGIATSVELTTPTGAAIVAALAETSAPLPALTITASGYGAGTADPSDRPNVTQVVIGKLALQTEQGSGAGSELIELSTNLDDATGEVLAHAISALIDAGALDAWVVPIVMKKGRPAHCLHVLCQPSLAAALTELVMTLTGTLGVRAVTVYRTTAPRSQVLVEVDGQPVTVKLGPQRAKAESDDAQRAAKVLGVAPMEVAARAERIANELAD